MQSGEVTLTMVAAVDDPPLQTVEYQRDLDQFAKALRVQGVDFSWSLAVREAVGAEAIPFLGTFGIKVASVMGPIVATGVGAWLHARYGREVRVKIGGIEVEAQTVEEIDELLNRAKDFAERNQPKLIK